MPERPKQFSPLPEEGRVFRLAVRGSGFLPADAVLPLPAWLEPTKRDVEEATQRGRRPGLSVWDEAFTRTDEARVVSGRPDGIAFDLAVQDCRETGQRHDREIDVVADPLDDRAPEAGWEGHALIEGIKRPPGVDRQRHKDMLLDLISCCRMLD
jgi:hypothetical protein